jgi:methyl-accepting chemotaxis protein
VNAAVELVGHLGGMPAPAMIIDKGFNIRYLNKAGAAVLRREQSQLIGAKCFNHFKTSDCNTPKLLPNLPR